MRRRQMNDCAGVCLGEEESLPCPLRENCLKYCEGMEIEEQENPAMFFTLAFGCEDYEPINEDIK